MSILEQHNDGGCFRLDIKHIGESYEDEIEYVRFSEDQDELFEHLVDKMNELIEQHRTIIDMRIRDDSK